MTGDNCVACNPWRKAMKTIVSALIALSVLAGIAAPASALDAKTFYEQQDACPTDATVGSWRGSRHDPAPDERGSHESHDWGVATGEPGAGPSHA